ncbi:RraA family protein [Paenarthrobacter sp. NPDC089989]|uniref:RraA family protein n=1 Tax=unclassified Paenarthrobacter TaxID=2634190 RepID=UPI00380F6855
MKPGFQALIRRQAISAQIAERYKAVPVSTVSDSMHRLSAAGASLRPMHRGAVMAGPAVTVRTRPGDNLMVHLALDMAEPGDIVVVDAGGDLTNAIIGELMVMHATQLGLGGIVINGAIRDSGAIADQDLPVFAAGVTHRGPYKDGPGEINVPISVNGMTIRPGDLVIGDPDGVLAVPYEDAESILEAAIAKNAAELESATKLQAGTSSRDHIRARVEKLGAYIEN